MAGNLHPQNLECSPFGESNKTVIPFLGPVNNPVDGYFTVSHFPNKHLSYLPILNFGGIFSALEKPSVTRYAYPSGRVLAPGYRTHTRDASTSTYRTQDSHAIPSHPQIVGFFGQHSSYFVVREAFSAEFLRAYQGGDEGEQTLGLFQTFGQIKQ
eukprot:Gb_14831 [translate_table: standard]